MVEAKSWSAFSAEEQAVVLGKVADIYEANGNPTWLKNPQVVDQFVGNITQKQQ